MSAERIEAVLDCQAALISAIDAQDADAIVRASEALAAAVSALGDVKDWPAEDRNADRLRAVLDQNRTAAMRVNSLAHWTRQRIDRIAELRGTQPRHDRTRYL
jgi:hypothetical protein